MITDGDDVSRSRVAPGSPISRGFRVVLVVAQAATVVIEREALASVWCFFAAILSIFIVLGIGEDHRLTVKIA